MTQSAKPIAASEDSKDPNLINRMLKAVAYPISAAAGFAVAHTSVRGSAYKTAQSAKAFEDIDRVYKSEAQALVEQRIENRLSVEDFLAKTAEIKRAHGEAVQARMEDLGLQGFTKKWHYINRNNKQAALIEGLTIAGISIGALLSIANSKSLTHFFAASSKEHD